MTGAGALDVYDFDGTIYPSDCMIDFALWCMNRHPKMWFTYFPRAVKALIQYKLYKANAANFKALNG